MKMAIMSDVHAYLPLLDDALRDAGSYGVDWYVFLGDMAGYGPSPSDEVFGVCKRAFNNVILGNHDRDYISSHPHDAYDSWLLSLPDIVVKDDVVFTHGALGRKSQQMVAGFGYICDINSAQRSFDAMTDAVNVLFIGHTHERTVWHMDEGGNIAQSNPISLSLRSLSRYIVNVGSVGYPREDGMPSYVVYDTKKKEITYRFLRFDVSSYCQAFVNQEMSVPPWALRMLNNNINLES